MKAWMLCIAVLPNVAFADVSSLDGNAFDVTIRYENHRVRGTARWMIHGHQLDVTWKDGATERFDLALKARGNTVAFTASRSTGTPPEGETRSLEGTINGSQVRGTFDVTDNKAMLVRHYLVAGTATTR